jgi:hypothetical protein
MIETMRTSELYMLGVVALLATYCDGCNHKGGKDGGGGSGGSIDMAVRRACNTDPDCKNAAAAATSASRPRAAPCR